MNKKTNKRKIFLLQLSWILIVLAAAIVVFFGSSLLISIYNKGSKKPNDDGYNIDSFNEIEHRMDNLFYAAENHNAADKNPASDDKNNINDDINDDDLNNESNINDKSGLNDVNDENNINDKSGLNNENDLEDTGGIISTDNKNDDGENLENMTYNNENDPKEVEKKLIAITFDDGPYPKVTNRILDILGEYGAKATFFVMGNRIHDYPASIKRVFEEGHEIANHTYGHKQLTKLEENDIKYEVEYSNEMINDIIDVGDVLLRPPYGDHNELVDKTVNVAMITWSIDSLDWQSRDKGKIMDRIIDTLHENAIILMHDLYESTADAVAELVPYLIEEGYELVTVSELFKRNGIELEAGKVYRDAVKK